MIFLLYLNSRDNSFNELKVFFRNKPLEKPTDDLFLPPLPDIMEHKNGKQGPHNEYWICFPGPKDMRGTPAQVVSSAQHVFWGSSFESTHWRNPFLEQIKAMKDFDINQWEERSRKDPGYVLKVNWVKIPYTITHFVSVLKRCKDDFNARESLSRLELYVQEISNRLMESIQESVVECAVQTKDYAQSKAEFDRHLKEAMKESGMAEAIKEAIELELTQTCSDAKIEDLLKGVGQRCVEKFSEIMRPAAQELTVSITQALSNEHIQPDEGEEE